MYSVYRIDASKPISCAAARNAHARSNGNATSDEHKYDYSRTNNYSNADAHEYPNQDSQNAYLCCIDTESICSCGV